MINIVKRGRKSIDCNHHVTKQITLTNFKSKLGKGEVSRYQNVLLYQRSLKSRGAKIHEKWYKALFSFCLLIRWLKEHRYCCFCYSYRNTATDKTQMDPHSRTEWNACICISNIYIFSFSFKRPIIANSALL